MTDTAEALRALVAALDDHLEAECKTDRVMGERMRTAFRAAKAALAGAEGSHD